MYKLLVIVKGSKADIQGGSPMVDSLWRGIEWLPIKAESDTKLRAIRDGYLLWNCWGVSASVP